MMQHHHQHPLLRVVIAMLVQLRLRYARGEVTRTDYLQAATDLGAAPSP
jgi:hypothetical protein